VAFAQEVVEGVVFPEPRKPVRTVTGTRESSGIGLGLRWARFKGMLKSAFQLSCLSSCGGVPEFDWQWKSRAASRG